MYATGIGLVIVGIERYEKEKEKIKPVAEEEIPEPEEKGKKPKKVKKPKDPDKSGRKFTDSFIEKIQKWFDEENE
jgi:cell division ATPase FtsA